MLENIHRLNQITLITFLYVDIASSSNSTENLQKKTSEISGTERTYIKSIL